MTATVNRAADREINTYTKYRYCRWCAVGLINVSRRSPSYAELERLNANVEVGGVWRPRTCRSRDRVALVVPYRDRDAHLRTFLDNIHPFLQRQQLHYAVYVVEQVAVIIIIIR